VTADPAPYPLDAGLRYFHARDGLRLAYRRFGPDPGPEPAILCLGGLARNSRDFITLAERLAARGHVVLAPDWRGRGFSARDPNPAGYTPQNYLDDLAQLLVLEGVHRAIVIGTSMGGLIACALGVAKPALLAGVMLNDIGPDLPEAGIARIAGYIGRDWPQPDWDAAVSCLKSMLPGLGLTSEEQWRLFAWATFREGPDGMLHADWDPAIARGLTDRRSMPDLWALFRSLARVPVVAIRGGQSDVLSAACFARMGQALPHIRLVEIPGAGHTPTLSEPPCLEAIDALCAACR